VKDTKVKLKCGNLWGGISQYNPDHPESRNNPDSIHSKGVIPLTNLQASKMLKTMIQQRDPNGGSQSQFPMRDEWKEFYAQT
jgi:hypothetical protein